MAGTDVCSRKLPSESTRAQYCRTLGPFADVIRVRHGLEAGAPVDFASASKQDFMSYALVSGVLGGRANRDSIKSLLEHNEHILKGRQSFVVNVPPALEPQLKDGQVLKKATRLQYWHRLAAALKIREYTWALTKEIRHEITDLVLALRIGRKVLKHEAKEQVEPSQTVNLNKDPPQPRSSSIHGHTTHVGEPDAQVAMLHPSKESLSSQSLQESLTSCATSKSKYVKSTCPSCDLETGSYNELLFHWCKSCRKGMCANHIFCSFCCRFYPLSAAESRLLQHIRQCSKRWAQAEGWTVAIKGDLEPRTQASISDNRTVRSKRKTREEKECLSMRGYKPCKVSVSDIFADIAYEEQNRHSIVSRQSSRAVAWHFCPDCCSTAGNYRKAFGVHRSPNALAQHYQDHLLRRTTAPGDTRQLPSNLVYPEGWRCTYPLCDKFTATSLVERVNHMSKSHGIPLLVDSSGAPQPRAQLQTDETLQQWTADNRYDDTSTACLYLTRGSQLMKQMKRKSNITTRTRYSEDGEGAVWAQVDDQPPSSPSGDAMLTAAALHDGSAALPDRCGRSEAATLGTMANDIVDALTSSRSVMDSSNVPSAFSLLAIPASSLLRKLLCELPSYDRATVASYLDKHADATITLDGQFFHCHDQAIFTAAGRPSNAGQEDPSEASALSSCQMILTALIEKVEPASRRAETLLWLVRNDVLSLGPDLF